MGPDHDCFLMNCHSRLEVAEANERVLRLQVEDLDRVIGRLKAALNKLAEDAEVAAQGGLHNGGAQ